MQCIPVYMYYITMTVFTQLKSSFSIVALIIANCVPLYGAVFLGWNVSSIVILYWLESAIIGWFNLKKMQFVDQQNPETPAAKKSLDGLSFFQPFFMLHYGLFMLVHGIFIGVQFVLLPSFRAGSDVSFNFSGIALSFLLLIISHAISYYQNFIAKKEYTQTSLSDLFFAPYGRIFVMHATVLIGGFLALQSNQTVLSLVIMVVAKTVADLVTHLYQHRFFILLSK